MTEILLQELRDIDFDSLTAKDAVLLRSALTAALQKADLWFANLAQGFATPPKAANGTGGRPPETNPPPSPTARGEPSPVKTSPRRRGRPVPNLKVSYPKRKATPAPIAVGGADAPGDGPKPAQLFQESYVSTEGPRPGAVLPADHPRHLARASSVTPEVDMADFAEVEEAMRKGQLNKVFQ